jgi:NADH-quinone oxidoreductase subunit L
MEHLVYLGLFLPLLSFIILIALSSLLERKVTGIIATSVVFISFLSFASLLILYLTSHSQPFSVTLYSWIDFETIQSNIAFRVDPLSILMSLIITGVGSLIHLYSIGYMDQEPNYVRYFASMNFFVFSMLLLIFAQNLLLLFVGWEGVGLASYLLIGFWFTRPAAAKAATKAFIMNRIGDLALLLGIVLTYSLFGTSNIDEISAVAKEGFAVGAPVMTLLTLLYFIGAIGKSAQLPLYTWLPDAMEGPTPISALIHAATMVTAGVYLVVRMHVVFILAPTTLQIIGAIGGATALFAALCASAQTDLKRVLAYSTISQLGFMFLACGVGAFYAAIFHLMTHAFMKSLLFLSAGIVVHGLNGATEMSKMGGLSKIFTKTHWLFLIGALSLGGVPAMAGFFSKDLILEQEYLAGQPILFYAGIISSTLTAFYLLRAYLLTFRGELRSISAHEGPKVMLIPVTILAFLSVFGGFIGYTTKKMESLQAFLSQIGISLAFAEPEAHFFLTPETWLAVAGTTLGITAALVMYVQYRNSERVNLSWLKNAFFIDDLYNTIFVNPLKNFAQWISMKIEPFFTIICFQSIPKLFYRTAGVFQRAQSGQIRSYSAWIVLGAVFLVGYLTFV